MSVFQTTDCCHHKQKCDCTADFIMAMFRKINSGVTKKKTQAARLQVLTSYDDEEKFTEILKSKITTSVNNFFGIDDDEDE